MVDVVEPKGVLNKCSPDCPVIIRLFCFAVKSDCSATTDESMVIFALMSGVVPDSTCSAKANPLPTDMFLILTPPTNSGDPMLEPVDNTSCLAASAVLTSVVSM